MASTDHKPWLHLLLINAREPQLEVFTALGSIYLKIIAVNGRHSDRHPAIIHTPETLDMLTETGMQKKLCEE